MQIFSFYKNEGRMGINFPNFMILLHMACRVKHVTNIHHYGTSKTHSTSEKNFTITVDTTKEARSCN
jgi:hypothetical protein